ncbi:protein ROLLING AND ERECT LEAF 2-like [Phragmites australis]|uniref:protein ROLLING AND ERECT LEAF 2-like n=1 Tax=Phragmites australis TaxID=29695 RepID=UPI002D79484A|nr:protein ROLLING AND ERECT LEAF 2-like [Phragmites australis]
MGAASSREGDAARAAAREHTKRCRERRRVLREAVRLRRHLAASHAAYLRSLGVVASTLTRFAVGEPIPVSDHTPPAVLVHRPLPPSSPPPLLRAIERQREEQDAGFVADVGAAATRTEGGGEGGEELRMVVRHHSLAEVAAGLEEYFVKASVAGDAVSSLLEISSAEFKGGSNSFLGALCCLSAPSVAHDRVDSMNGRQRHSSTLQQLLAWEKKLYKDVKAREHLQIKHDKMLAELRDQEYSRKIDVDIHKLKAAWVRARAQLAAASQAVDASSSAIAELCNTHLARQLLGLCHATLDMWKVMRQHHEAQSLITQQLRGLSSLTSMEPTTEIHHDATRALEAAMNVWCVAMGHMTKHQRDYVHAIHGWLKLTLTPINGVEASPVAAELTAFVDRWGKALDRVHCVDALKSMKNFSGAARALYALQSNELRVARRVRQYSRELDRKSRMLRQVEKSYYDSYAPAGISLWHWGRAWREDHMQARDTHNEVAQRREEIAACRKTVEDEMRRHAKAIDATRSATVSSVQGKLPAVFQAMAAFSTSLAHALEAVCRAPQNTHAQ